MRRIGLICLWLLYLTGCLSAGLAMPVSGSPLPPPAEAAVSARMVPVLVYHDLGRVVRGGNGAVIAPADFEWQMAWLKDHGYTTVTAGALAAWLEGKGALPERSVLITFDDGYASAYTEALPVLRQNGQHAVLFLITDVPADAPGNGMLTWTQVRTLARSGAFEIQGHTNAAHDMEGGAPLLLTWTEQQIRADYAAMLAQFTRAGLPPPIAIAYPFGQYNQTVLDVYRQAGFRLAFTVERGYIRPGDDPLRLKRLIVWPGLSRCQFAALVTGEAVTCH